MKPEDAIRPLKELSDRKKMADQCDQASASDIRLYHALDTAIEALEKQIPKKYMDASDAHHGKCPVCGVTVYRNSYCWKCGQNIDWGD